MEIKIKNPQPEHQRITHCYHCGDPAPERIIYDDKVFCCHGCMTVYDLLENNGLDQYYELNSSPGKKSSVAQFEFLENPKIVAQLLDFDSAEVSKVTFFIPSIHCSSCIWLLENLARLLPGVTQSRVFFLKKKLTVTFKKQTLDLKKLVLFLSKIGYPPDITLASESPDKKIVSTQGLKIAIAGFCFGNSMLLSLPEYLDVGFQLEEQFQSYFGVINLLLALPVVFYSASDYFKSAFGSLKKGFLNIDVPISLGIMALFGRSLWEISFQQGSGYVDSLTGLVFLLLIGKWFQNKSYQAMSFERDYKSFFPIAVKRISGVPGFVGIEEIRPGDELEIHNQEILPIDGLLVEGQSQMDYGFVTGESIKETKLPGDILYAGGRHFGSVVRVLAQREVSTSYLTSLWNHDAMKTANKPATTDIISRVSVYFTFSILAIAALAGVFWAYHDASKVWVVITSVLIVACPCALALSVPFAYGHTMRLFGRAGFYLKNSDVIEHMAKLRNIVFDKTGTLTTLVRKVSYQGTALTDQEKRMIYSAASNSLHPLSRHLAAHLTGSGTLHPDYFSEIPGAGIEASWGSRHFMMGSAAFVGAPRADTPGASIWIEFDDQITGVFSIESSYREGIFDQLQKLRSKYKLHLLSGDTEQEQELLTPHFDTLKFRQKPADKLSYMEHMSDQTLMIGDGLNDAGALRKASVGIAIVDDLHQFSPSCDAILKGEQLKNLSAILSMSRYALKVVYVAFTLSFLYNAAGLFLAVTGQLTPLSSAILMPLSSISVVGLITFLIYIRGTRGITQF